MEFAENFSRALQDLKQDEEKFYIKYILEPFAKEWQKMEDLEKEKMVGDIVAAGKALYNYEFSPDEIKSTFAYFVEEKTEQPLYQADRPLVLAFAGRSRSTRKSSSTRRSGSPRRSRKTKQYGSKPGRTFDFYDDRFSWIKVICNCIWFLGFFWIILAATTAKGPFPPSKNQEISLNEFYSIAKQSNVKWDQLQDLREEIVPDAYYTGKEERRVPAGKPVYVKRETPLQIDAQNVELRYVVWEPSTNNTSGLTDRKSVV